VKAKLQTLTLRNAYRLFLGASFLEGGLALWFLFRVPSEAGNAFLGGFSLQRTLLGAGILLVLGILLLCGVDTFRSQRFQNFLAAKLGAVFRIDAYRVFIVDVLSAVSVSSLAVLLFYWFPETQRVIFFLPNNYIFAVLGERAGVLIGWLLLVSLQLLLLYLVSGPSRRTGVSVPVRWAAFFWMLALYTLVVFLAWSALAKQFDPKAFLGPGGKALFLAGWFTVWAALDRSEKWAERIEQPFFTISLGLCIFVISLQFAQWFGVWVSRPADQYIRQADSFLHGYVYLYNPPPYTHDLTFYGGRWYVSNPPFPILLIMPFVALQGINGFYINTFSLALAALAAVTVFSIVLTMRKLDWIRLSRSGAVWLACLLAFGTVFWWLAILGTGGSFSQVVTVLFCGLAFLAAIKKAPAWVSGACLAAAVMSRPNVFVLWPALVAIAVQLTLQHGKIDWKAAIKWGVLSAIPVVLGAGLLLSYNYLRFESFTDFGYGSTINGQVRIVENVEKYGLFSLHFVPDNLWTMFVALPELARQCRYFLPFGNGMSMIMSTPALLYVLRKFKATWWSIGCGVSILLSVALLAMYSNNGANQYGYRYVLDFIVPALMLMASNAGEEPSKLLRTLILLSIGINYYGTISMFNKVC
jgi:hypothetical protein